MLASYKLGAVIVVSTIAASALFTVAVIPSAPPAAPAGQNLGAGAFDLSPFKFTERSGREVSQAELADDVWIASFIFTRCPTSCPRVSEAIGKLQSGPLKGSNVKFVSFSVDPDFDTPEVLKKYGEKVGADPQRWLFLTGPKDQVYGLILNGFHLSVAENPTADPKTGAEQVAHSDRLALVDRGSRVIGIYSSSDADALKALAAKAKQRSGLARAWVRTLPAVNASLNGTCAVLLALGFVAIRSGRWKIHATCMTLGVTVSAVFLACYLVYHYFVGSVAFQGAGPIRMTYFTILISHTLLATFGVVPLVTLTLLRVIKRQFDRHAVIARVTFPIWMYVSITGVVIYLMLYQLDIPAPPVGV